MTHRLQTDKPNQHWAVAGARAAALAVLMLSTTAAVATPTAKTRQHTGAPPGILVTSYVSNWFDNAGTNPRFTSVTFSTLDYYDESITGLLGNNIAVRTKTNAQLNAMNSPPPNPFTVTADVEMTNDEGETASGQIRWETTWAKAEPPGPSLSKTTESLPAGTTASAFADAFFDNAGTGARFTAASFSTLDYYDADRSGVTGGFLDVTAKTRAELQAMDSPPSKPFTVQVTVTMTNNAGQEATGTVDYVTNW